MKALLSFVVGILFAGLLVAFGINDEIRVGGLRGTVVMTESDKPLPGATVTLRQLDEPTGTYHSFKTVTSDESGEFDFGRLPAGSYSIESYAKAHSAKETKFSVREGEVTDYTVRVEPGEPYLRVFTAKHVYLPQAEPELTIEGFGQEPNLAITLYKVDFDKVVAGGGLQSVLQTAWRWDDGIRTEDPSVYKTLQTETRPIERRDVEGAYVETVNLDALPSGMYWVSARAGKSLRSGTYLLVSDIALVTKRSDKTIHGFVAHMNTGKSLPNAEFTVYQGAKRLSSSRTDANGFARIQVPAAVTGSVIAVATRGTERAIVSISLYSQGGTGTRVAIFTDRPIYRPGHTVQYKGIVRTIDGSAYRHPAGGQVNIDIQDADSVSIKKEILQIDEHGGFSGAFDINAEAATGSFYITANAGGSEHMHSVEVAAYRKPDFEVNVTTTKPLFVRGEQISGQVEVDYYFGGAVPEASAHISVYRRPHYGEYEEYFADFEGGDSGEYLGEIKAVTDGQGIARFSYDTSSIRDPESDYVYTFEASVSDDSGRYFDGVGTARVTRGEFEVVAYSESYVVEQGDDARIEVQTQTFDGNPLDIDLDITYGIETWDANGSTTEEMGRTTATTRGGNAVVAAKASRSGYMLFSIRARDSRGNVILARTGVYVPGEGPWSTTETKSLSVKMDKKQYQVGDGARAVIIAPTTGDAWVTVESSDIYISRKVALTEGGNLVDFEVDAKMLPNSYVTVQYLNSATFYEGVAELKVDQSTQKMTVTVTPERTDYQPGETAVFTLKTADSVTGRPVSADLAFSLVDESIYAIREDRVDLLKEFYPVRYSMIETSHSFPEIYLGDGDKDTVNIDVRRRFLDTAHWDSSVVTDAKGEARLSVVLPDNLTTWRATARGLSIQASLAGQGVAKIVAAKPLMVRLNLPRFLVQGDEVEISATVNASHDEMDATVTLDARGVEMVDGPRKAVQVMPNRPQTVRWRIRAEEAGSAEFRVTAVSGEPNVTDAMEASIPVIAMGRLVTGYAVDQVAGTKPLNMDVEGYVAGSGTLDLTVASTLADTLSGSFDYLVGYPYGCVEQTLSRYVPTLIVSQSPYASALSPETRSQLPDMIADGYTRLRSMQNSDGSWGWWEADGGDPRMTGLVLESYALAAGSGHPPGPDTRMRAIEWARRWLQEAGNNNAEHRSDRLWLIRGLAAVGDKEAASAALQLTDITTLNGAENWASIALAAHRVGNSALVSRALAMLKSTAAISTNHASWKSDWYGTSSSAHATLALATIAPTDPIVVKASRYLLDSRRGNYWHSTHDTAYAILAITKVSALGPSSGASQVIRIIANGTTVESGVAAQGEPKVFKIDMDAFDRAVPTIAVDGGTAYFTANWRYKVNDDAVRNGVAGKGLSVSREYYTLRPRRLADGKLRLLPSGSPVSSVAAGETVRVVVKIRSNRDREYMMLEDPLPSGFEVLERSSDGIDAWEWRFWYSGLDIRDDRIVYFMRHLSLGENVIEYTLRAESPGSVTALPAVVSNMYEPDDSASTKAHRIEVRR